MENPQKRMRGPAAKRGEVRARLLAAAVKEFEEQGYEKATMRKIARRVGCDPALVNYYFGSKQSLFRECFNLPSDPATEVLQQLLPGVSGAGERLVRYAFTLYDEKITARTMSVLMSAVITDPGTTDRFRQYFRTNVLDRVSDFLGAGPDLAEQIELSMSLLHGVATMRYLVKLEPLASMPRDRLVAELAPIIQMRIEKGLGLSAAPGPAPLDEP